MMTVENFDAVIQQLYNAAQYDELQYAIVKSAAARVAGNSVEISEPEKMLVETLVSKGLLPVTWDGSRWVELPGKRSEQLEWIAKSAAKSPEDGYFVWFAPAELFSDR